MAYIHWSIDTTALYKEFPNAVIEEVPIEYINIGDVILCKDGRVRTVSREWYNKSPNIGYTLWGDSYMSGYQLVKRIKFKLL